MSESEPERCRCPQCGLESPNISDFARTILGKTKCWRCLGGSVSPEATLDGHVVQP